MEFFYFQINIWKWQLTRQRRRFILSIDARFVSYMRFRSIRRSWTPPKKARKGPPTLSPLPSHSNRNERPHLTLKKNWNTNEIYMDSSNPMNEEKSIRNEIYINKNTKSKIWLISHSTAIFTHWVIRSVMA